MKKKYLPALVAIVFVGVLVYLGLRTSGESFASVGGNPDADVARALDRLAQSQEDLSRRLERLENGAAYPTKSSRAAVAGGSGASGARSQRNAQPVSPAEFAARREQAMLALENKLVSEPISAAWASRNQNTIENFLKPSNLAKLQLSSAGQGNAKCHSSTCRISIPFESEMQGHDTSYALMQEIAQDMPAAQTFFVPQPDGSVQMVVYASSQAPSRRRSER